MGHRVSQIATAIAVLLLVITGFFAMQLSDMQFFAEKIYLSNPDMSFIINPTEYDLGLTQMGTHILAFKVTNLDNRPRQIVGLEERCWAGVCFTNMSSDPVSVPAGETFSYMCVLSVNRPGPFETRVNLHLEDGGIRSVPLTVRGVGVQPGGQTLWPTNMPVVAGRSR